MKSWITGRLAYLDQMWSYNFTGIDNQLTAESASVFPNPFNDQLNIHFSEDINLKCFAEIYNSEGKLEIRKLVDIQNGQFQLRFSERNDLKTGLYLLRVVSDENILLTRKLMKCL